MSKTYIADKATAQQCKALLTAQVNGTTLNTVDFCPEENVRNITLNDGTQEQFITTTESAARNNSPTFEIIETDDFAIQARLNCAVYDSSDSRNEYYEAKLSSASSYVIDKLTNNVLYSFTPSTLKNESGDAIGTGNGVQVRSITKWSGNKVIIVYTDYTTSTCYNLKAVVATVTDSAITASDTSYTITSTSALACSFYSVWVAKLALGKLFLVWNQEKTDNNYLFWYTGLKVNDDGTIKCGTPTQVSTSAITSSSIEQNNTGVFGLYTVNENTAYLFGYFNCGDSLSYKAYRIDQVNYSPALTLLLEESSYSGLTGLYPFISSSHGSNYTRSYNLGNYIVFRAHNSKWYKVPSDTTDFTNAEQIFVGTATATSPFYQVIGSRIIVYYRSSTDNSTVSCYDAETDEEHSGSILLKFETRLPTSTSTSTTNAYTDFMIFNWGETPLIRVIDRDNINYDVANQPYFTFVPYAFNSGLLSCMDYNVDTHVVSGEIGYTKIVSALNVSVNTWCSDRIMSVRFNGDELFSQQVNQSVIIPINVVVGENDVLSVCFTKGFGNVKVAAKGGIMEGTI